MYKPGLTFVTTQLVTVISNVPSSVPVSPGDAASLASRATRRWAVPLMLPCWLRPTFRKGSVQPV